MSNSKENTPYFPIFQAYFKGRPNISCKERMKRKVEQIKSSKFSEFRQLFSPYIPVANFSTCFGEHFSRTRVYTLEVVFWGFLNQIFLKGTSCSEIVKKIQSWMIQRGLKAPSSATGAYCKAKKKISLSFLKNIFQHTSRVFLEKEDNDILWKNRSVKVVDGTGLSMPDTAQNQKVYPQNGQMKKGCGFPQLNMVALFSLASGILLGYETGNKHDSELRLCKKLWKLLNKGDVVLGDRGFYSFGNTASLFQNKVDSVIRLSTRRSKKIRRIKILGDNDFLCRWNKPINTSSLWSAEEWDSFPGSIIVRIVEVPVICKGFRTEKITIMTTLLGHLEFTPDDLAKLYFRRWSVELRLKEIKTTMGMEILSSKSPRQIQKEIVMFAIAYNVIRGLIFDAAKHCKTAIDRISFSGALQQLNQWLGLFINKSISGIRQILFNFYLSIVQKTIPDRPGRSEPRAKKRRPKNFNLMNKPRGQMVVDYHRNNMGRKNAFFALK